MRVLILAAFALLLAGCANTRAKIDDALDKINYVSRKTQEYVQIVDGKITEFSDKIKAATAQADKDGDGTLDWSEWLLLVGILTGAGPEVGRVVVNARAGAAARRNGAAVPPTPPPSA